MKNLCLVAILFCTACGGVGTEPRKGKGEPVVKGQAVNTQEGADQLSCNDDVKSSLVEVAQFCAADMNVDLNRVQCIVNAQSLVERHPNFVCSLESGQLVDAEFVKEQFIRKYKLTPEG